jgi:hypothetical protein
MYGKHHTEETKEKIKRGNIGKKMNSEQRKKCSDGRKGMKFSEVHKLNLSISHRNKEPWNKGKEMSEETCKKMRKINIGKKLSEETKKKMSESRLKFFEVQRQLQENSNVDKNPPNQV